MKAFRERIVWYTPLLIGIAALGVAYGSRQHSDTAAPPRAVCAEPMQTASEYAGTSQKEEHSHEVPASYAPVRTHLSPNFTATKQRDIRAIVIHTTEGSGIGAEEWLTDAQSGVSAHYLVMENGDTVKLVEEQDSAWHVRSYNEHTLGVEFAGYHDRPLTGEQLKSGAELLEYLMQKYSIPVDSIKSHSSLDSARREDPGELNMQLILRELSD